MGNSESTPSSPSVPGEAPTEEALQTYTDEQLRSFLARHRVESTHLINHSELLSVATVIVTSLRLNYPPTPQPSPGIEVALNIYNLVPKDRNHLLGYLGCGLYHTGVEVCGWEWTFGGCGKRIPNMDPNLSGVFFLKPRTALPIESFEERFVLGTANKTPQELYSIIERLRKEWKATSYHLLNKNCNHFTEACVQEIDPALAERIPAYINRAARIANFVVPEAVYQAVLDRAPKAREQKQNNYHVPPPVPPQTSSQPPPSRAALRALPSEEELRRLSVRELKALMFERSVPIEGCIEKSDMVARLTKTSHS